MVVNYRLTRDLVPVSYNLTIKTYFKPDTVPLYYDGSVEILFTCDNETSKLVMHMRNLDLNRTSLRLTSVNDDKFDVEEKFSWTVDPVTHFVTFEFDKPFRAGYNYTFSGSFRGYTEEDEMGFYRSYYFDDNNDKK